MSTSRRVRLAAALLLSLGAAQTVMASQISFTASEAADLGIAETFVPGALADDGAIGSSLTGFGVDFTYGRSEGYYSDIDPNSANSDSFFAFCGVNASGECDLGTGIDGRIVLTGTSVGGATRFL